MKKHASMGHFIGTDSVSPDSCSSILKQTPSQPLAPGAVEDYNCWMRSENGKDTPLALSQVAEEVFLREAVMEAIMVWDLMSLGDELELHVFKNL